MSPRNTKGEGTARPLTRMEPYLGNTEKDRKSGGKKRKWQVVFQMFSQCLSLKGQTYFSSRLFGTQPMGTILPGDFKNAIDVASIFTYSWALEKAEQIGR